MINNFLVTLNNEKIIEDYKIGVIGLGKLGDEVAQLFSEIYEVEGYDIIEKEETNYKIVKNLKELCIGKQIIFISVPTPHHLDYDGSKPTSHLEPKDFDYSIVKKILIELNQYIQTQTLVVLISTVLPGTIRREFKSLIKNYDFIYNPYLIAMGTVKEDVLNPEMIIMGTEDGKINICQHRLYHFYEKLFSKNLKSEKVRYEMGTWEDAESIKIFYNTMISAKLSIVNMIQDVSEKIGNMNVDVVTGALEQSTKRIVSNMYMKAGMGDGGPCHPRDNIALRYLAKNLNLGYDLFDSIMKSREIQAKNIAMKLMELRDEYELPIVIMGESYKPGVPYTDGSYSKLIGSYLNHSCLSYDKIDEPSIFLLGHRGVFNNIDFPTGSVILDPWREYDKNKGNNVIYYGKK
jgi:UDPglucose 6-dehydrogenase